MYGKNVRSIDRQIMYLEILYFLGNPERRESKTVPWQ